jgi:hypothetical protein
MDITSDTSHLAKLQICLSTAMDLPVLLNRFLYATPDRGQAGHYLHRLRM